MKLNALKLFSICLLLSTIILPILVLTVSAEELHPLDPKGGAVIKDLQKTAGEEGLGYETYENIDLIKVRVAVTIQIIKYVLSFLGVIFLILIIIGGYQWMTAGGNEEIIKKARARIINAVIGLAIILLAYTISRFIFGMVLQHLVDINPTSYD